MQRNTIGVLIIGLIAGGFLTYGLFLQTGLIDTDDHTDTHHGHDYDDDHGHEDDDHDHGEALDVATGSAPVITIEGARISSGNNIDLQVSWENFIMAPESADSEHVLGEGHLHIYVGGEKIGRMYGEWYHIYDLGPGEHVIEVTATTNDHRLYTVGGEEVADTIRVTIE